MLLLVLILILIAFGLLVIALLTGTVLWAWVSVAVSAVAALVLVVDHLQRRAAVRAGTEATDTGNVGAPEPDPGELEQVTEILPVMPPATEVSAAPDNGVGHHPDQQRSGEQGDERATGPDRGATGPRTLSLQPLKPPGADQQPSGAAGASSSHPGESSQGVAAGGGSSGAGPSDRGVNQPTAVVSGAGGPDAGVRPTDPTVYNAPPPSLAGAGGEPAAEDGEPPEESRDQAVAALVAQLPDEVVVVDEQPRYHLGGCRALVARAVIPLPAQEAVELGFTPCGWCTPDRALAERHPARAQ